MRFQGRITHWNDAKGFGSITWNGSSDRVFVHVSAFTSKDRRPAENDIVIYEVAKDENGRFKAIKVSYPQSQLKEKSVKASTGSAGFAVFLAVLFMGYLLFCAWTGRASLLIFEIYGAASLLCFVAYWHDKSAAQNNKWRTPESTLHLFALFGGWPGALAAQKVLRHKTVKQPFQSVFIATIILNIAAFVVYTSSAGL
ncbi:MAG: cold shock and DUF1294 domain-containing protein [Stagnimonas sp.]|nr:cold shock and DUF1294 domain-containing protein [Stagnimonas sp.]